MPITVFKAGAGFGEVVDGAENLNMVNEDFLPAQSVTTEELQPNLFPILIGEPSLWNGTFTDITVEDVPGSFGASVSNDYNIIVYTPAGGDPQIAVWRDGYNPASGVVLSFSSDGGATWSHSAAVAWDGGNDSNRIPTKWDLSNNQKRTFSLRCSNVDNFLIQNGSKFYSLTNNNSGNLMVLDMDDGTTASLSPTGVAEAFDITSIHFVNGKYLLTIPDAASGEVDLNLYSADSITGNWTKEFTTTEGDYETVNYNGSLSSYITFIDGVYYWAAPVESGTNQSIRLLSSTDLNSWSQLDQTASLTGTTDYIDVFIFQLNDGTNVLQYQRGGDTYWLSFDNTGFTSAETVKDSNDAPILAFKDPQGSCVMYGPEIISELLTTNEGFDDAEDRFAVSNPSSDITIKTPWSNRIEGEVNYSYIQSVTGASGGSDMVIRIYTPRPNGEEVRSVENYGIAHSLASPFLRGE